MKYILLAMALALGGCSTSNLLTSNEPQQTIYTLHAPTRALTDTGPARVLEIMKPDVPPGFETDRIALYLDGGQKLDYYAGAKWTDLLDDLMQEVVRRGASASLPYVVAVTPGQSIDGQYRLHVKLNDFQPVYKSGATGTPDLSVNLEFTLLALPQERVVRSFMLTRRQPASSNRLDSVVKDLGTLLQESLAEGFQRIDSELRANPAL